ncbi:MAG TPA: DHA2 family efflux MFS transporter permease subunit [Pseudonocardiaceae bacterium]|jgi:EmrB/QacA subfamily drug resistance transporter
MAKDRLDPALVKLGVVLVVGAMAPLLDSTIVNVALGTLARTFNAPLATVQWVSTGYLLALVLAVPITTWAVDRVGGKRLWLISLGAFLAGSLLSGIAWNLAVLIGFRVVQGLGAGLMLPILQTLLIRAAAGKQIGRLMSVITLPVLAGPILGPVVGGLIVAHWDWRWIFYVNAPLCLLAILLAVVFIPADAPCASGRLDVLGLALLSPALVGVLYGLSEVGSAGGFGSVRVLVPMVAGLVLLGGFVVHALRVDQPLIDLRLFRSRSFATSSTLLLLSGLALFGSMLLLPLYYQDVRGQSIVAAGLLLAPQGIGSLLARGVGGLADRIGARPVVFLGIALTVLGTVPFAFAGAGTNNLVLVAALVVRGVGLSAANLAIMVGAFQGLPAEQIPHASSGIRIMQQLGGSLGTAVLAVILQSQLATQSTASAFGHTFGWALGLSVLAVIPAVLLPRRARHLPDPVAQVDRAGAE